MAVRNILITGASSGIGAALARVYAGPHVRLILWGRDRQRLEGVARACDARGAETEIESFDISSFGTMSEKLSATDDRFPIDLAILNAGVGGSTLRDDEIQSEASVHQMTDVNFVAPILAANLLSARMAKRASGHIVFMGSIGGEFPLPMAPVYAATKAGLALFSEALGIRMKRRGVGVTLVAPGFVDTPMSRSLSEPRPFLLTADMAAKIIKGRIDKGASRIIVPWQFAAIHAVTRLLPRTMLHAILSRG